MDGHHSTGRSRGSHETAGTAAERRAHRLRAVRIARLLAPAAWRAGGFASSEARIAIGAQLVRPAAVVALGDPPPDGVLAVPPLLVVELDPAAAAGPWLALGATAVWLPAACGARCVTAGDDVTVPEGTRLEVPGWTGLALPAGELAGCANQARLRRDEPVR